MIVSYDQLKMHSLNFSSSELKLKLKSSLYIQKLIQINETQQTVGKLMGFRQDL